MIDATMRIEVCYALPGRQELLSLTLPADTTLAAAIEASGLLAKYPDIQPGTKNKTGIFGKLAGMDTVLRDGDRVEIYRPLIADPKVVRRQRAAEGKAMKKGGSKPPLAD